MAALHIPGDFNQEILPLHLQLMVPYHTHKLEGVCVRKSKWGLGVFWDGDETLPAGVYFTIYHGKYFESTPECVSKRQSKYLLQLKFYTKFGFPEKKNSKWYCDAKANKSIKAGVGQFINSSSPYNWDPVDRLPNARYEEHFRLPGKHMKSLSTGNPCHRVLCQTICPVSPGEEFLTDYHTYITDFNCHCFACINERFT
jgi:hypothetical protein